MPRSPFGPAAEQRCDVTAHAELMPLGRRGAELSKTLAEKDRLAEKYKEEAARYRKEAARNRDLAERERTARRAAEARAKSCAESADRHTAPGPAREMGHPAADPERGEPAPRPDPAETDELRARLDAAERERDGIAELLRTAEEERDAALRARDAALRARDSTMARLRPRRSDGTPPGESGSLQGELEAPTLRGVLERAGRHCSLLVVTADPDAAERLEHHRKAPHWRRRLAAALATLHAYAEAKSLARAHGRGAGPGLANLKAYCDSRSFPTLSPAKVILSEGKFASSSPRGKADRKFRVPVEIIPSGYAVMVEHIRIGDGAPPAPRLHYLDDTDRSGLVVIGFFGEHLTNASTN
ncbi:hypothetical protein KUM39_07450 [Streptomyces sp. J2-1]|uniref:hypothetical protein n=1 Tax=Streptomyces corallincola TaxID=2851888 RepID=UPI001C388989|nr:hypothetical protein [Streptomyces corallincola]MBV2354197.1 hypothetical protein [Streptomyces corallincola]